MPYLTLHRLRAVFDFGQQLRLNPDAAVRDLLGVGLGLAYQRTGNTAGAKEEMDRFRALKDEARYSGRVLESLGSMGR